MPNKDARQLWRKAKKQGFIFEQGRKHLKIHCPDGYTIYTGLTPSRNALLALERYLRKHGYAA